MSGTERNPYIVEVQLKERLATQCLHSLKIYARQKMARSSVKPVMKRFLARIIRKTEFDYEFSVLLTLCFSVEFEAIKKKVSSGSLTLEHISYPDYWERVGYHVDTFEAIFFVYTFTNELFPSVTDLFVSLQSKQLTPDELEQEINNHIRIQIAPEAQG